MGITPAAGSFAGRTPYCCPDGSDLMAGKELTGMKVAILATNGFEQAELEKPRKALDEAGAETTLIAPQGGTVQGMNHDKKGDEFAVNLQLDEAHAEEFDAVLLPGGVVNADQLRMEEKARWFVRTMDKTGKPIAVICHGAWLLVSAGLVKGRRLTSYYTLQDDLRNAGAHWSDEEAVVDRNWVSSRQPDDIPAFNTKMVKLFAEARQRAEVRS
jgi:protease I